MSERTVIFGATSGIARAIVRRLAQDGESLVLVGRDAEELERAAKDVALRANAPAAAVPFDAARLDELPATWDRCVEAAGGEIGAVILCHGLLPDQALAQGEADLQRGTIDVNYTSFVILAERAAAYFEARGRGSICGISSVAGDRGRQSNYIYGSTKAAVTAYLQGLRNRLHPKGVHVLTVKPGFVDTAMVRGKVSPKSPLLGKPEVVADQIVRAIRKRKDVIYTLRRWRWIMLVVRAMPEWLFKRLRL